MEGCDAVERELDKVSAKFGEIKENFDRKITEQVRFVNSLKEQLESGGEISESETSILRDVLHKLHTSLGRISSDHRNLHSTVSKVGKAIDRNFNPDLGPVSHNGIFAGESAKKLTQVVTQHFYRQGMLNIGDKLYLESGITLEDKYKEPFVELHRILDSLKQRELEPALTWTNDNKEALMTQGSTLEFKLHRLAFLNLIAKGSNFQSDAIIYARNNFGNFLQRHEKEIQVLMGALLFSSGNVASSRYSHLFDNTLWDDIQKTFTRDACSRMGLPVDSPLTVCFEAGCKALPVIHNISQVMQVKDRLNSTWVGKEQLPVEIDLGKEFHYHSVFACPILRQQSSETNPPMRLSCGHLISKDALRQLATGNKLKCPYCPGEKNVNDARQIMF